MNEHEQRIARAGELLYLAGEELAPLLAEGSPLCFFCKMLVTFAKDDVEHAANYLTRASKDHASTESPEAET